MILMMVLLEDSSNKHHGKELRKLSNDNISQINMGKFLLF